jgi:hypothetical protein
MWMGGFVPLGYEPDGRTLSINPTEAETVRTVYRLYLEHGNVRRVKEEADQLGLTTKLRSCTDGRMRGGRPLSRGYIYKLLSNPLYVGRISHKGKTYEGQHPAIIDTETWDTVQGKLVSGTQERRSGTRAAEPSLLAGMLYDDRGNRLSPSHAVKKGLRYRYYVSQALLQERKSDTGSVVRVPAREIEELVMARIGTFFGDARAILDELSHAHSAVDQQRLITAAGKLAGHRSQVEEAEHRQLLMAIATIVTISETEVRIALNRNALRRMLLDPPTGHPATEIAPPTAASESDDRLILTATARLKLCSGEVRIIVPPDHAGEMPARPNKSLINAIVRAHKWKERLFSEEVSSVRAIAQCEGVTDRYVARILRLAFLAPDIVEAILEGNQPAGLEIEELRHDIPLSWNMQEQTLRFIISTKQS